MRKEKRGMDRSHAGEGRRRGKRKRKQKRKIEMKQKRKREIEGEGDRIKDITTDTTTDAQIYQAQQLT